ncbi:MAG: septum site-determining protein MinD [Oscillospiraceae bacterium]|jgi:septum site-determining protein MinD|nr:septum site-determining protein MinD [Oscillospiraceae bacterium]
MGKIIGVASGKGGTGKTTTVAALASCLAVLGHKTLCIDFDAELRNLDLALGMTDFAVMDYMDVVVGRMNILDACSESPKIPNLYFLAAPTESVPDDIDPGLLKSMFDDIRGKYDYCIVDSPSGIGTGFRLANSFADMSIIVTTGEYTSMRDAGRTANALRELGTTNLRLLVNRVLPKNFKRIKTTVDDVIDTVGVQLIGLIPEDNNIFMALHKDTPVILYKKRSSAYDFLDAARRLTGDDVPLQQYKNSSFRMSK